MKKLFTISLVLIMISASLFGQPPEVIKYQAVMRDAAGDILANQSVDIRISIHNETPTGTIIYQETFSEITNQFGLVNLNIGLGTPQIGSFNLIDWGADSKFLEIEIYNDAGGGYLSMGTSELFSVPYSLYSDRSSDSYWDLYNSSIYYNSGNVGIGTSTPGELFEINGNGGACGLRVNYGGTTYDGLYGDFRQTGSGGLQINSQTPSGGGGWADISLMTNGTTKMFIESGGNVGIGTTTPNADLHVEDHIRIGEDPNYSTVFGELYHEGGGNGFKINANAGGGTWADLYFQTNGNTRMFIESAGNVGIGTTNLAAGYRLSVDGKVACEEVLVEYSESWPDYVFLKGYKLRPLDELESNIFMQKHLPGLPSAEDVKENGIQLGEMQKILLEKVEELTLYTIQQDKQIKALQQEIANLKSQVQSR
ncbi:MAG: hypothetical protein KQI35_01555 [Bacteroidetes bacterium]|nr:hypothetical protein [Bacteroidota bacterium]